MQDKSKFYGIILASALTALAAIAGIIESFIPSPLSALPGVKLGLANIFITCAFYYLGTKKAFLVLLCKTLIVFIVSGNPVSLAFSVCGGLLSFIALALLINTYKKTFTFIGISSVCALAHALGQILAAFFIIGNAIFYYAFLICVASIISGAFCGMLINLIINNTEILFSSERTAEEKNET